MRSLPSFRGVRSTLATLILAATPALAQVNLPIYDDSLTGGFQDWSWNCTRDFNATQPVYSGTHSIAVTINSGFGALRFNNSSGFNQKLYQSVSFWINGGYSGGQLLQISAVNVNDPYKAGLLLPPLAPNAWQHYVVPLSTLGVTNGSKCTGFWLQDSSGGPQPTYYVDNVELLGPPPPAVLQVGINATLPLRTADDRWFGINTAAWDGYLDSSNTLYTLTNFDCKVLRWPGGSWGDIYHEANPPNPNWGSHTTNFIHVATNIHAQAYMIVNYGTGTPQEAADWVRLCNITHNAGFKYWEIGNENYGTWEADSNTNNGARAHSSQTYAGRFYDYYRAMKAVDPSIKIGAVVVPGEDAYVNPGNLTVGNPRTGQPHSGWTPGVLTLLKSLGVTPDFVIHHFYAEYNSDSDVGLLQASSNWELDSADLRQQLNDYLGTNLASHVEMVCTENNADSGNQGRQSTSLVNALYLADSATRMMRTEFNAFLWWDLRNGADTAGDFNPGLYGWRTWGDLGIMLNNSTWYPTYYSLKLLKDFARGGDSILDATSNYPLLAATAAHRLDGSLTLLVINKARTNIFNSRVTLTNFVPSSVATVRSYGIPEDEAARTNAPAAAQDVQVSTFPVSGTAFNYTFQPYSMTLFTFTPYQPPQLQLVDASAAELVFQLQGYSGSRYVVEWSTDLVHWTPRSTNTLSGTTLNITNSLSPGATGEFWRAVSAP